MQTSGRTPPFSAATSKRSIRLRLQARLGGAGNDGQLIDVGDQDLLPPANRPADAALPRLDPLDDSLLGVAVFDGAKQHAVARRHNVALIGRKRLQQPPGGALKDVAVFVLDHADQAEHAEHPSAAAGALIHVQMNVEARLALPGEFFAADGPSPGELALAAEPLALQRGLVLESVLPILLRPIGGPARMLRFLRKSARIFFFLAILRARKRGQVPFARNGTRRVLRTNWTCPLLPATL